MIRSFARRLAPALALAAAALALAACGPEYPNSTFTRATEHNAALLSLWNRLLLLGTIVFVLVESLLIYTIVRFRRREGAPAPKYVHGNTPLEITWTLIPVVILALIAVPTVQTIFRTQSPAQANSVQVEVYGHQWWWEFRYPQYGVVTANELYLPVGRTASFQLRTQDVVHSFWVPQLGGKRDLVTNKTNHLWYTPDTSLVEQAYNGFCAEYCGASHANMRIRAYTVSAEQFERWAAHQRSPAALSPAAAAERAAADSVARRRPAVRQAAVLPVPSAPPAAPATPYVFPLEKLRAHNIPKTPVPAGLTFDESLLAQGDAARGRELLMNTANLAKAPCRTCHNIRGEQEMVPDDLAKGPNLTHIASRHTIAGGLFPNDARHLALWIKNAQRMKPGTTMNTFGIGEYSPLMKGTVSVGLTDREIADIVAYLLALK